MTIYRPFLPNNRRYYRIPERLSHASLQHIRTLIFFINTPTYYLGDIIPALAHQKGYLWR